MAAVASAADSMISSMSMDIAHTQGHNENVDNHNHHLEKEEESSNKRRRVEVKGGVAAKVEDTLAAQIASRADREAEMKRREKEEALVSFNNRMAKLPRDTKSLLDVKVDWTAIEMGFFISTTVRPWVSRKVEDLLGESETTMVDFIISQVSAKSHPSKLLEELKAVLDEDAEVFVCDLWRLIINYSERLKLPL